MRVMEVCHVREWTPSTVWTHTGDSTQRTTDVTQFKNNTGESKELSETQEEEEEEEEEEANSKMGIWFYQVTNMGNYRAVVKYGTQPNTIGPSGNGYSVLLHNRSATPDWCIGNQGDPLVIDAKQKGRYTWKIYDLGWELHVKLSVDGGEFAQVGLIKILHNYGRFDVWIYGDKIVIGNADKKLGRQSDGRSFRYFLVSRAAIVGSDHSPDV